MKSESEIGKKQLWRSARKLRPMYLLFVGNDTVSISVWRGTGRRSTQHDDPSRRPNVFSPMTYGLSADSVGRQCRLSALVRVFRP